MNLVQSVAPALSGNPYGDHESREGLLVGFQCQGSNVGPMGTIRAGNGNETGGVPFVAYACNGKTGKRYDGESDYANGAFEESECARPITTTADRSRAAPLIAFAQNSRDEVRELGGNIAGALSAQPGMKQQTYVAFAQNQSGELRTGAVMGTLNANTNASGRNTPMIQGGYGVRRLMPIECERCQGMPDDWTRYGMTEDGKEVELSDSARYRLIGNSVAIPTVEWIAKRISGRNE